MGRLLWAVWCGPSVRVAGVEPTGPLDRAAAALDDGRVLVEGRGLEPRQMAAMLCAVVGGGGGEKNEG